ncbi:EAL domain-containing protein [Diaphorobacter sp.]|uniref:bifunctional diguanylate cyclase/phosphodiesterase n=1 Tax=Diaphorobacter sp. TaxID=1934310 RepID=UPI003D0BED79
MMHPAHHQELRQSLGWLFVLLAGLCLVWALPAPSAARGLAGYLPLHTMLEVLSISMAAMVFGIAWVTQQYRPNGRALILGLGLMGVGLLDLTHALSYDGMPAFITPSGPEKAINFWLAARLMAALALLGAALWPRDWNGRLGPLARRGGLAGVLLTVGAVHYVLLFQSQWMPRTFIAGEGLTDFKINFEYGLIALYLAAGLGFLTHLRQSREFGLVRLALAAFTLAAGEFFFTLYANVTDLYNLAGHLYKFIACWFLYRGLFVETVHTPYHELRVAEARQRATLDTLPDLLFELNRQGVYLSIHTNEPSTLAAPAAELLGKSVGQIMPADSAATCMQALAEAERSGSARGQRISLQLATGLHHFELAVSKKPGLAGHEDTYLMLARNITATVLGEQRIRFESRLNAALLDLQQLDTHALEADFLRRGVEHAAQLTDSAISVIYLVQEGEDGSEMASCSASAACGDCGPCQSTLWSQALRERRPVVLNQIAASACGGQPQAPEDLQRLVSLPVVAGGKVRMLLGVANKAKDYSDQDLQALQTLADAIWQRTIQRRQEAVIHRLSEALEQSPHQVVITDVKGSVIYVNRAFSKVSGYTAQEILGQNPRMLQSGLTPRSIYEDMWGKLPQGQPWQGELINRRKNGQVYTESASLYPIRDAAGRVTHYVAHKEDITPQREAEERIRALSDYDTLTSLLNKKAFDEQLDAAIEAASAVQGRLSVVWMDLDNFKVINETMGHRAGDELLVALAKRLRSCMGPKIALARYSGDTFAAIVPDADQASVALLAQDALAQLQTPLAVQGNQVSVSASAGIAVYPGDAEAASTLAAAAEVAMYRVKQDGRNALRFFAPEMQAHSQRSLELAAGLKDAVRKGELFLVYQPQRALTTGELVGAEALLRWHHPKWGLVSPAEFIPIAEQNGTIVSIDMWVVEHAARQLRQWDDAGLPPLVMAVNVSAAQFARPQLVEDLQAIMQRVGVSPQRIEVELTEAVALKNPVLAESTLRGLHQVGFRVSLDDFGTGYSSMSYLKRYAIDTLKIDQSFVRELADEASNQAIVKAIIKMAQSLHMTTIAEGVETAEQATLLDTFGCDHMQGYWYSRPLEPAAFEDFARSNAMPAKDDDALALAI